MACMSTSPTGRCYTRAHPLRRFISSPTPSARQSWPCGWKTRSVFDRYRTVNEADLADGLGELAAAQENTAQPEAGSGNVAAFRKVAG